MGGLDPEWLLCRFTQGRSLYRLAHEPRSGSSRRLVRGRSVRRHLYRPDVVVKTLELGSEEAAFKALGRPQTWQSPVDVVKHAPPVVRILAPQDEIKVCMFRRLFHHAKRDAL